MTSHNFVATYNAKDLILYALSLGFGSTTAETDQQWDLRFVYEKHQDFAAVPTFCLVLLFWAKQFADGTSHNLPSFPPDLMASVGVLPTQFLRIDCPVSTVLHTWQSITWHRTQLPVPKAATCDSPSIRTVLRSRVRSVVPKKSGTFVTTETIICLPCEEPHFEEVLCTLQSTALVVGIPPEHVIPYVMTDDSSRFPRRSQIPLGRRPLFEWRYKTISNQALLYRLASGDTNHIHVTPVSKTLGIRSARALLHGLCTLGLAARAVLTMCRGECNLSRLEGRFTKPVLVGDEICVKLWRVNDAALAFVVINSATNDIVIDQGYVELNSMASPVEPNQKIKTTSKL
jgi:acyl dehydratase